MKNIFLLTLITIISFPLCILHTLEGPSQPEAAQFEPVDATDLVNLTTGDLSYVLPLMDVSGPEMGYPIVLSYHAGIGMNQEPTWVGLGWTLNPGAINRNVNGYPDDYNGDQIISRFKASIRGWSVGIGIGYGPAGIDLSYDSHKGFGMNLTVGVVTIGTSGASVGINAYGFNSTVGTNGVNIGASRYGFNASLNVSSSGNITGSVGYSRKIGPMSIGQNFTRDFSNGENVSEFSVKSPFSGFSIDSNGGSSASFSSAGVGLSGGSAGSEGEGKLSTTGFSFPIPFLWWINVSYSSWVWKLDNKSIDHCYGYWHMDEYWDEDRIDEDVKFERQQQGMMLYQSQDIYQVNSQGLSGTFAPFAEFSYLLRDFEAEDDDDPDDTGNLYNNYEIDDYPDTPEMIFRFIGESGTNFITDDLDGNWGNDYLKLSETRPYGSQKINPIFNEDPSHAKYGDIIGFSIITTDGKIYEYMQPVYQKLQYSFNQKDEDDIQTHTYTFYGTPYVTSWLLTAIKGPDYYDANTSEGCYEGDWGYWVKFNYETVPGDYIWRAPYTGYAPEGLEDGVESFSFGVKEQVFLSSIETETHIAEFQVSDSQNRAQASGLGNPKIMGDIEFNPDPGAPDDWLIRFRFSGDWVERLNGYPQNDEIIVRCYFSYTNGGGPQTYNLTMAEIQNYEYLPEEGVTVIEPNIEGIEPGSELIPSENNYTNLYIGKLIEASTINTSTAKQLDSINLYKKPADYFITPIKTIVFTYDFSLCHGTPNSIAPDQGKQTLKQVEFLEVNGASIMPPYLFEYANGQAALEDLNPNYHLAKYDRWGSYTINEEHTVEQNRNEADKAKAWSLTKITTPLGSEIEVEYEADSYYYVGNSIDFSEAKAWNLGKYSECYSDYTVFTVLDELNTLYITYDYLGQPGNTVQILGDNFNPGMTIWFEKQQARWEGQPYEQTDATEFFWWGTVWEPKIDDSENYYTYEVQGFTFDEVTVIDNEPNLSRIELKMNDDTQWNLFSAWMSQESYFTACDPCEGEHINPYADYVGTISESDCLGVGANNFGYPDQDWPCPDEYYNGHSLEYPNEWYPPLDWVQIKYKVFVSNSEILGGGIRVKSLKISDADNTSKICYKYVTQDKYLSQVEELNTISYSSGVTASLPNLHTDISYPYEEYTLDDRWRVGLYQGDPWYDDDIWYNEWGFRLPENMPVNVPFPWVYEEGNVNSVINQNFGLDYYPGLEDVLPGYQNTGDQYPGEAARYRQRFLDHAFSFGRPAPGVIYSRVEIINVDPDDDQDTPLNGKTSFEYYTAKDYDYEVNYDRPSNTVILNDRSGMMGKPKFVSYYKHEIDGNEIEYFKIKETIFNYTTSEDLHNHGVVKDAEGFVENMETKPLGLLQEKYVFHNELDPIDGENLIKIDKNTMSVYDLGREDIEYYYDDDSQEIGSNVIKLVNFVWDKISGANLGKATSNSQNETQISIYDPAYWHYPEMEQASDETEKNMISQIAKTTEYKTSSVDIDNIESLQNYQYSTDDIIGINVTTWKDWSSGLGMWHQDDTYKFIGNLDHFLDFTGDNWHIDPGNYIMNPSDPSHVPSWKRTSNITKYDNFSHPIEELGIDGVYSAAIFEHEGSLPVAIATNASYDQMAYYNFEYNTSEFQTGVGCSDLENGTVQSQTGEDINIYTPEDVPENRNYIVSWWIKLDGLNDWEYNETVLPPNSLIDFGGADGYIDEIRIYPKFASMSTYAYDPLTWKLITITDGNNISTYFDYDGAGRLIKVSDHYRNILKTHNYHYDRDE